jgi:hypothetical protein
MHCAVSIDFVCNLAGSRLPFRQTTGHMGKVVPKKRHQAKWEAIPPVSDIEFFDSNPCKKPGIVIA